ncbi:MAG: hypothetical protein NVS4B11_35930 [Ktedonobacteraceae bacterium]
MALPIGTVLDGKFKIVQVLGEGGMGTVYKVAQEAVPGMPPYYYAVKELLIGASTTKEDRDAAIDRFNKEIALLRGLKNSHIASLMLPFQERGNYYFVMEFVPGRSLEKMLEDSKAPLPEDKVIKWGTQVCEALTYIHTRVPPIILRDLKPGNIMITTDDDVQLIDFGIARRFDPNKRTNTENLGTISYASPEHLGSITMPGQKRTAQNPGRLVQTDARSDIYSLGATLYHLLTNYEPDPIQTPPTGTILAKNPRLRTVQMNGRTVCPIEQVIIRAMQQEPALRFQNAEEMRVALHQCLPNNVVPQTISIPAISSPNATFLMATNAANGLICPKCGFHNRPGAKFCKRDGQPLVQGVTVAPTQVRPQPRSPIQARPVQRPIQPRPAPIQARPVQSANGRSIQARPVSRVVPPSTNDPNVAYRSGLQLLANKSYVAAIQQFREAQRLGGSSYDVLYNLGRAYRQYGQSVKETDKRLFTENMKFAAEQFEDALRLRANAVDVYFQSGLCYRDLGLYQQATGAFTKALGLAPQDPAIYYQLGLLAMDQGYHREAEARFLDGLKISPKHALLLIATGRLYNEMKQIPAAISTLRQATQEDPMLWEGWYELGRAHMKQREWNLGLSALEQARQLSPYVSDVYSAMATCYLKMNKKGEARQLVNETLQRDPTNAEALRLQKQL